MKKFIILLTLFLFIPAVQASVGTLNINGNEYNLDSISIDIESNSVNINASGQRVNEMSDLEPEPQVPTEIETPTQVSCETPNSVRMMGNYVQKRKLYTLGNNILSFNVDSNESGRYETYATSSNNGGRKTWISTCPGGEPLPNRYCSSTGLEATSIRLSYSGSRATCEVERGNNYYYNIEGSGTFYGRRY